MLPSNYISSYLHLFVGTSLLWITVMIGVLPPIADSFSPVGYRDRPEFDKCLVAGTSCTVLFSKVKRGKLGSNVDSKTVSTLKKSKTSPATFSGSLKQSKETSGGGKEEKISSLLAQWAAQSPAAADAASSDPRSSAQNSWTVAAENADTLESFDTSTKSRKQKKPSFRQLAQSQRDENTAALVSQILAALESGDSKTRNVNDILNPIQQLISLPFATDQFRSLSVGSKDRNNYRLAWVGSDEAVCHIGTGLHKVPLARLQEVFLSLPGRNTVELLEVIRVIGPFPNVKNALQGTSLVAKSPGNDGVVDWTIRWESLVDGTGKERLAGTEQNIQKVPLHLYFCTDEVIVAVVPPNKDSPSDRRADICDENGKHILLFVKEASLDVKLDKYRVI